MEGNEEMCHLKSLKSLVEKLTTSGNSSLDEKQMKSLKKICKLSDQYVASLFHLLIKQLKKKHAEIRLSSLQICNEIFSRSHIFRQLVTDNLDSIYNLTILFVKGKYSLKPLNVAERLKSFAISTLHSWNESFGEGYIYLRHGYDYLRDVENVDFENNLIATEEERRRRREQERKEEEIKSLKIQNVLNKMEESSSEISSLVTEFNNTFKLLIPDIDNFLINTENKFFENDLEIHDQVRSISEYEYGSNFMREHGLTKETLVQINLSNIHKIQETSDNEIIITLLKEQVNAIKTILLNIKKWEQSIVKYSSTHKELMLKIINLKKKLESILTRFDSVKFIPHSEKENIKKSSISKTSLELEFSSDEDYDDFIDVPFDDPRVVQAAESEAALFEASLSSSNIAKNSQISAEDLKAAGSSGVVKCESSVSQKIMNREKSIENFLHECVEKPSKIRPSITGLSSIWSGNEALHEHEDGLVKPTELLGIATRAINIKEEWQPVRWECRAPLPSGRLCPRKDRERCPFHGTVIPRDHLGTPVCLDDARVEQEIREQYERAHPPWQDPVLLAEIRATTGVDLDIKKVKKRKRKYPNLTNIKEEQNTPKARLKKKIFSKKSVRRINKALSKLPP